MPRSRAFRRTVTFAVLGLLTVAELALGAWILVAGSVEDTALAHVPGDAAMYAHMFTNPSRAQKRSLERLLERIPQLDTRAEADDALTLLLDGIVARVGLDYENDVRPWAGRQLAFFVTGDGTAAVLIESDDREAALAAVARARDELDVPVERVGSYGDTAYEVDAEGIASAAVGSFLVLGNEAGIKGVVDTDEAESLSSSSDYTAAVEGLPGDRIGLVYVAPAELPQAAPGPGAQGGPFAAVVYVTSDAVVVEVSLSGTPGPGLEALATLPEDAWFALSFADVEQVFGLVEAVPGGAAALDDVERGLGFPVRDEVSAWGHAASLSLRGGLLDAAPALIVHTSEPAAALRTIDAAQRALIRVNPGGVREPPPPEMHGFTLDVSEVGAPLHVGVAGNRVIVALRDENAAALIDTRSTLGGHEGFVEAAAGLGDDYAPYIWVDVAAAGPVLGPAAALALDVDIRAELDAFSYVIGGTRATGARTFHKVVLRVR